MPDNLELEVKQILSRLTGLDVEEISDGADVINDLGIDSLKIIEIATEIERTYKVAVKDSELGKLRTVKDAVSFLRELIARKNG
jgi:acyl carrier protein